MWPSFSTLGSQVQRSFSGIWSRTIGTFDTVSLVVVEGEIGRCRRTWFPQPHHVALSVWLALARAHGVIG